MKKVTSILLILAIFLPVLAGCGTFSPVETTTVPTTQAPTKPPATEAPTSVPPTTQEPTTVPPTTEAPTEAPTTAPTESNMSATEARYKKVVTLTRDDCDKDYVLGGYSHWGIRILADDCERIDTESNLRHVVPARSFYRAMALCLSCFSLGNDWTYYAPHILGYTPESRSDFAELVDDLSSFICTENSVPTLIQKFLILETVESTVGDDEIYTFQIADPAACAAELGISEEMLAYIFGMMHDSGGEISFSDGACTIVIKDYH